MDSKKHLLIIGSSGFIGGSVANYFASIKKYYVSGYGTVDDFGKEFFYSYFKDRLDGAKLKHVLQLKSQDIVVDCTGPNSVYSGKNMSNKMLEDSLGETLGFCEATIALGGLFVYISSAAVYGTNANCSEDDELDPVSRYGEYKALVERKLYDYFGKTGRLKIIRPFSVYGPFQKKQLIWDAFQKLNMNNEPVFFGTGKETRDWIHIYDFCALLEKVIFFNDELKIINAGTGCATSVEVAIRHIANCTGVHKPIIFNQKESVDDPKNLVANTFLINKLGFYNSINFFEGISSCVNAWRK